MWLCADPGETTGWSLWDGDELYQAGQTELWEFATNVSEAVARKDPGAILGETVGADGGDALTAIVCEDWALYPWVKLPEFDKCVTARLIGCLELAAWQGGIPIILQPASIKDAAKAAGAENYYLRPLHENRHANDSIQHGVFYLARNGGPPGRG